MELEFWESSRETSRWLEFALLRFSFAGIAYSLAARFVGQFRRVDKLWILSLCIWPFR